MFKVLVSDKLGQAGIDILESAPDVELVVQPGLSEDELIGQVGDVDALVIRSGTQVNATVLEAAKSLRVVGRAGVGVDNVDVDAATRQGVIVMNTPSANTVATAELAMAMMLAASRNVVQSHASLAGGQWSRSQFTGTEIRGKTLGIIGFGRIGRAVASRAQAFGAEVCVYDPFVSELVAREYDVELMTVEGVLQVADIVTLHTVLNDETRQMINADTVAIMKPGAILVNVARGALIDEKAVAAALDSGQLRCAAVDVYSSEPPEDGNPLVGHPKAIHTPHLGASTQEAQRDVAVDVATQILEALRGEKISNCVNLGFTSSMGFGVMAPYIELAQKIGHLHSSMADAPITELAVQVVADQSDDLLKPVGAGLLNGVLDSRFDHTVNYVNAPFLGEKSGLAIEMVDDLADGQSNAIIAKATWGDRQSRIISGVVYGDGVQRITRISEYRLEADPNGIVLLLVNQDVPGVIGSVGSLLGELNINIGEWRLGRNLERAEALSFINLDTMPSESDIAAIAALEPVKKVAVIKL